MQSISKKQIRQIVLSAFFLALGMLLPFLTGQIPDVGRMLLPMHIPVLLCGMICGWQYGLPIGFILPLFRSLCFGAPPMPEAAAMAFELATYGCTIGILYAWFGKKGIGLTYVSLLLSMLAGRAVWGIVQYIVLGLAEKTFTLQLFLAGAFTQAVPGILLQLVLLPALMFTLERTGVLKEKES